MSRRLIPLTFAIFLVGTIPYDIDAASHQFTQEGILRLGGAFELICHTTAPHRPYWTRHGEEVLLVPPMEEVPEFGETVKSVLKFERLGLEDIGNYTCHSIGKDLEDHHATQYQLKFDAEPKLRLTMSKNSVTEGSSVTFHCSVVGFPLHEHLLWMHLGTEVKTFPSQGSNITTSTNLTSTQSILTLEQVTHNNNGSYSCRYGNQISKVDLIVTGPPVINFGLVKAVGKAKIFLSWIIFDGNLPITHLDLKYIEGVSSPRSLLVQRNLSQLVLQGLQSSTNYSYFMIIARNSIGSGNSTADIVVTTLKEDPTLVPTIRLTGNTFNSLTIGWSEEPSEFFERYVVLVLSKDRVELSYETRENPYMIENLEPGTYYIIKVQACSKYTGECNPFSNSVNVTTMDGISSAPLNLVVQCFLNQSNYKSLIKAFWTPPANPRGQIVEYSASLFGNATYRDSLSPKMLFVNVDPINKSVTHTQVEFSNQLYPNTNYSLSVCAKTRPRACGEVAVGACKMPPSIPNLEELSKVNWKTVTRKSLFYFMITMPDISQRNGSVCCYRIIVVRLVEGESFDNLESPGRLKLSTYDQVHNIHNASVGGAYVAEQLDPSGQGKPIMIGDENPGRDRISPLACDMCSHPLPSDGQQGTNGNFRRQQGSFHRNSIQSTKPHRKRHASSTNNYVVYDGPLNPDSTYTAYLDALVVSDSNEQIVAHSKYFSPLKPTRRVVEAANFTKMNLSWYIMVTLLVALIVVILAIMCVMRWRRKEPGDEEYGLSHSLHQLCRRLRGQQWVPSESTVEMAPIPKEEIISAFLERHKDGDYGFQQEFENLPDRFSDRSCHESDKRDNVSKNRYPDIKAYDQTRVKLLTSDSSHGSDYINANFVVGYKERKKFICAQGPMEATVIEWWRLVWEQRVTLILMLTNTEEYNKTKCAKYWPSESSSVYGDITVTHNSEKVFSDYLVRNLQLKRNRPTEQGDEERQVYQYHYLVWKDFMAPEYPIGIIRFIKRFNEVYSPDKGPILVHCSAGVGRTGTLVALDSLLEQLAEENSISIFNTICDLRHQRNFLVQSLKQYIFVYRALMEAAQFGDTEIRLTEFKSALERLKGCDDGKVMSRLEEEFEKLSQVIEDRKSFSVGTLEENRKRNRHDTVIPYDRCRVILSPMPSSSNEICTYINASFIEGYDNTEQFVITQDPLENTIADFWRMVVEQNVRTIVMFSEIGEEACPRYWPEKDQETAHDYIKVKYMQSQSFPFYYKREFTVTNSKTEDSYLVTQFQYNGWPVGAGEVPESTRGLVELVDTTLKFQDSLEINSGPTIVHCSDGAQRSCIFVALAILVKQMMTESRVDVFTVVRKLRSQRQALFQNVAQFELVYRGLLTYSELHMTNGADPVKQ